VSPLGEPLFLHIALNILKCRVQQVRPHFENLAG